MPGFDGNDRQSESPLGYRADVLQPAVSSYNGYVFPPALNSGVTVVPEYDDSGRTVKYLTIAVSVSFIVTDMHLYGYETANLSASVKNSGMETVTKSLITRLSQPCQSLIFTARGYGDFVVNGPGGIRDVDYGPKPQVIELEPLGGSQAYRVEWLCVTRVPPCLRDVSGQLIQFNYSTSWGMDPSGFMIRTIEGSAELPRTRGYQTGGVHASDIIPYPADEFGVVKNKILKAFPMTPGFRRQVSYAWKESRKVIQFKIEDVEIRSDSPFLPGISDIDLTQSMSSSLEDGAFQKWKVAYSANIEVVNSKTTGGISEAKKIAWVWIGKFLQEKRKLFENTVNNSIVQSRTRPIPQSDGKDIAGELLSPTLAIDTMLQLYALGDDDKMDDYNTGAFIYPVHISITDSIYSNTINLTVAYVAVVTSDLLGQAVGLFEKVELKGLDNTSWVKYIDATNAHKESIHVAEPTEMIVDLCHSISAPASSNSEQAPKKSTKKTEALLSVSLPEKEKSWEYYHNDFYFLDSQQNVLGSKLHGQTDATTDLFASREQQNATKEMANVPFEVGGYIEPDNDPNQELRKQVKVYSPTPTVCYIRMVGKASRFNGRINPPKLIGVGAGIKINAATGQGYIDPNDQRLGGALAHKYGDSTYKRSVEKTGLTDANGNQVIRHKAEWSQTYVLDRAPSSGQLTTTGIPHRFGTNFDD